MLYIKRSTAVALEWIPSWVKNSLLVLGCSGVVALFAKVIIPLPFTPIPLVLQDLILVSLGILLGAQRGMCIALVFLLEGLLGFPVFAGGGCGLMYCAGTTCGYLIGYPIAAFTAGALTSDWTRSSKSILAALIVGNLVIFSWGVLGFACWVGFKQAFSLGFVPFIPGNVLKTVIAFLLLKKRKLHRAL